METNHKFCTFEIKEESEGGSTVFIHGKLDVATASEVLREIAAELKKAKKISSLKIDLSDAHYIDDYGAIVLYELKNLFNISDADFQIRNMSDSVRNTSNPSVG